MATTAPAAAASGTPKGIFKQTSLLSEYRLTGKMLGVGISGPVKQIQSIQSGEFFALKVVGDSTVGRREAELLFQCAACPHIVRIVDVYENAWEGGPHILIVMEQLDGGDLFTHVQNQAANGQYFCENEVRDVVRQLAVPICFLHSRNIAHRDLKPENYMFGSVDPTATTMIKLIDFGYAKQNALHTPVYTTYYAAPEVLRARDRPAPHNYDKACDMWSLGVIIYILLCGYPPFYSLSQHGAQMSPGMERRIRNGVYDFDDSRWENISPLAKDLVSKLLLTDPFARLTVTECLDHPWFKPLESEAAAGGAHALMLASSPGLWVDARAGLVGALAHMRVDDSTNVLPLSMADNALLRRRRQRAASESAD